MTGVGFEEKVRAPAPPMDERNDLHRAEQHMCGVLSGQVGWSTINSLMSASFNAHYSFSTMAMDEAAARARTVPAALPAASAVARTAGPRARPLASSVVLSARPGGMP